MNKRQHRSNKPLFYLFLALLVFVPLPLGAYAPSGWGSAIVWINALTIAWLLLWALGRAQITPAFRKAWPVLLVFILWLLWVAFQLLPLPMEWLAMLSPQAAALQIEAGQILQGVAPTTGTISLDVYATESVLYKSISYFCLFALTLLLVNSRRRLKLLAWTLVISGLFQALYGSLMVLSGIEHVFWYEKERFRGLVTGTFYARAHLAGYLVISLSVGIGLMLSLLDRKRSEHWKARLRGWMKVFLSEKFRLRLFLIIMVIALVMTQSRMGNISFMVALLSTGVLGMLFLRHARRSLAILLVSIIIIDVVVVGAWFGIDKVMDRLEKTVVRTAIEKVEKVDPARVQHEKPVLDTDIRLNDTTAARLEDRGRIYRDMKNYMADFVMTGSGLGTFRHVYPIYRGADVVAYYSHAHNDYYQFFAEVGALGIALLGLMLVFPLVVALRAMARRRDQLASSMAFAVVMSITAILLHSTVDFNFQIPAYAMTFMVVLALAFIVETLPARKRSKKKDS